jgi:gluconokinase
MVIIVMGVAGAGKSTIGRLLARRLGWDLRDADDLHPAANREKMRRGIALTDADREPWLAAVRTAISQDIKTSVNSMVACSALKQAYRDRLMVDPAAVKFVYLKGDRDLIARRLAERLGQYPLQR